MKYFRLLILVVAAAVFFELLLPLFSAKTSFLLPILQNNCGAIPVFLQEISDYRTTASVRLWKGFMMCGASFLAFLLLPGVIKFFEYVFSAVSGDKSSQ